MRHQRIAETPGPVGGPNAIPTTHVGSVLVLNSGAPGAAQQAHVG
jgi:hypothetical protein